MLQKGRNQETETDRCPGREGWSSCALKPVCLSVRLFVHSVMGPGGSALEPHKEVSVWIGLGALGCAVRASPPSGGRCQVNPFP